MKRFKQYIEESLAGALVEPQSSSSEQAKKLGLVYVGFGRYEDPKTQQITHIVQDGRLVPFSRAVTTKTFTAQSGDDFGEYVRNHLPEIEPIHKALVSHYKPERFSEQELAAVQDFAEASYEDVNYKLSSLPAGIPAKQIQPEGPGDMMPAMIGALDAATNKLKSPMDFVAYCSINQNAYDFSQLSPGTSFAFKSFRSLTLNPNIALNHNEEADNSRGRAKSIILQINVPKGARGMYIDEYSPGEGEMEYLLPRGAGVQIVNGPNRMVGSNAYIGGDHEVLHFECVLAK